MSLSGAFLGFFVGFLIHTIGFEGWSFLLTSTGMNHAFQSIKFHTCMSKVKIITLFHHFGLYQHVPFAKNLNF